MTCNTVSGTFARLGSGSMKSGAETRALISMALFLGALAASPAAMANGSTTASLMVTATILKHASIKTLAQPASVVITESDIARGYVEVPAPAQVTIHSNSPAGYVLVVSHLADFVRQTRISGLSTMGEVGSAGGVIAQAATGRGMNKTLLNLGFRFALSASARQGVYAWPVQLAVAPL